MQILKTSKDFLDNINFFFFKFRTFDLSTLYTIIRSEKLIICLIEISTTHFTLKKRQATLHAYGFWSLTNLFCQARYMKSSVCQSCLSTTYLSRSEGTLKIISSTSLWEQTVLHSLSIFFLFSYEAEFIQNIVKGKLITMANAFNLHFHVY